MKRVAWTRLTAWAIAACLLAHGLVWVRADIDFGLAFACGEFGAAALLLRRNTRAAGVGIGAAAESLIAMSGVLEAHFTRAVIPSLILILLLLLGRSLDRRRRERDPRLRPHGGLR